MVRSLAARRRTTAVVAALGLGGSTPTLGLLSLSGALKVGVATSGTITGATPGSTIVGNIPGITINSAARTYAGTPLSPVAAVANALVETLAGATGSPRSSPLMVNGNTPALAGPNDIMVSLGDSLNASESVINGQALRPIGHYVLSKIGLRGQFPIGAKEANAGDTMFYDGTQATNTALQSKFDAVLALNPVVIWNPTIGINDPTKAVGTLANLKGAANDMFTKAQAKTSVKSVVWGTIPPRWANGLAGFAEPGAVALNSTQLQIVADYNAWLMNEAPGIYDKLIPVNNDLAGLVSTDTAGGTHWLDTGSRKVSPLHSAALRSVFTTTSGQMYNDASNLLPNKTLTGTTGTKLLTGAADIAGSIPTSWSASATWTAGEVTAVVTVMVLGADFVTPTGMVIPAGTPYFNVVFSGTTTGAGKQFWFTANLARTGAIGFLYRTKATVRVNGTPTNVGALFTYSDASRAVNFGNGFAGPLSGGVTMEIATYNVAGFVGAQTQAPMLMGVKFPLAGAVAASIDFFPDSIVYEAA